MEESISEWGKVIVLGAQSPLPLPTPLLKVFGVSLAVRQKKNTNDKIPTVCRPSLQLSFYSQLIRRKQERFSRSANSLAVNFSHPRIIEHHETNKIDSQPAKPIIPALLLTTISTLTALYIYRLTGQKLELQTRVQSYTESLVQEKQARASLTAPQVKVFSLQGNARDGVSAKFFWDTEHKACLIYLNQLPQAGPNQYFQLWFLTKENKFVRAQSFRAETGTAELSIRLPTEMTEKLEYVLVSQETTTNSPFPEGPILVKGLWP